MVKPTLNQEVVEKSVDTSEELQDAFQKVNIGASPVQLGVG
jgi:hypothetical protein